MISLFPYSIIGHNQLPYTANEYTVNTTVKGHKCKEYRNIEQRVRPVYTSKQVNKVYSMNILLVHPLYPDTFWSFRHALKFISKKALFPPLGILTVAAMLPEGWEKRLIDMNVIELTDEDI